MELKISNKAKKDKQTRTAMSQQALVNSLLSEKQATAQPVTQPAAQPVAQPATRQATRQAIAPVTEWGR